MPERRVYIDRNKDSFASAGMGDVNNFEPIGTYHDASRFSTNPTFDIAFDSSGTTMYYLKQNTLDVVQYNLSIPWDITTSQYDKQESFSSEINANSPFTTNYLTHLEFNSTGDKLHLLFAAGGPLIYIYDLSVPWDVSSTVHSPLYASYNPHPSGNVYGFAFNEKTDGYNNYWNAFFDSGVIFNGLELKPPYSSWSEPSIVTDKPSGLYNWESRGANRNIFSTSFGGSTASYNIFKEHYNYNISSLNLLQVANVNNAWPSATVGPYGLHLGYNGQNLYITETTSVTTRYFSQHQNWYGSSLSGLSLQSVSGMPLTGEQSIASYVSEGANEALTTTSLKCVNSGTSYFEFTTEIPFISGMFSPGSVKLEVAYDAVDANMSMTQIDIYTQRADEPLTPFEYSAWYLASGEYNFPSGNAVATIDLTEDANRAMQQSDASNSAPLSISFDLYSPTSGSQIYGINLLFSGIYSPGADATGVPLYMSGIVGSYSNLDLFLANTYNAEEIDLFTHGHVAINSGMDLFLEGMIESTDNIDLYMSGAPIVSNLTLFIPGSYETENFPLYMYGFDISSGNFTQIITGHILDSGNIPLYMTGHGESSGVLPFTLDGGTLTSSGTNVNLYTYSTTTPSMYKTTTMVIGDEYNPNPENNINLFLSSDVFGEANSNIPLFLGHSTLTSSGLDFILYNNVSSGIKTLPLYLDVGLIDSGNSNIPLYISRDSEGIDKVLTFYIPGPSSLNNNIPLYLLAGNSGLNDNINLYINGIGVENKNMEIFTKGI